MPPTTATILETLRRYAIAVAAVAIFWVIRTALQPFLHYQAPLAALILAVLLSSWFGGLGPGVLATLLSASVAAWLYMAPLELAAKGDYSDVTRLTLFLVQSLATVALIHGLQVVRRRADASKAIVFKQARELAVREHHFREFFEASTVGMVQFDLETGVFLRTNAAFSDITGYSPAELRSMSYQELTHPDDRAMMRQVLERLRGAEGQTTQIESRLLHKSGRVCWASGSGRVVADPETRALRLIGVVQDVTEKQQAAEELRRAKEQAESASRAKTQFLANMSHEIRTPLGVILGFADFLLDPSTTREEATEQARAIKRNGEQLFRIVNELLDVSKVEAGKLSIEQVAVPLPQFLDDVASLLAFKAQEKGLVLRFGQTGSLPSIVKTDPLRLRQILLNVVGNAIKFTERGTVDVAVRAKPASTTSATADGPRKVALEFLVTDTGIGMTPEQQGRIFQPFAQGDDSMTRRFGGAGLGIYLSRRLARLLDGDLVLVDSAPGKGSTFRVTVTATTDAKDLALDHAAEDVAKPKTAKRLADLKILLVEDAPDNRLLIGKILRSHGAEVELAVDGIDGVEKALAAPHDVVLMDMQMPRLDGIAAVGRLRDQGYDGPIIALTAHAFREDEKRCLEAGCDDYMSKPMDVPTLVAKLSALPRRSDGAAKHS